MFFFFFDNNISLCEFQHRKRNSFFIFYKSFKPTLNGSHDHVDVICRCAVLSVLCSSSHLLSKRVIFYMYSILLIWLITDIRLHLQSSYDNSHYANHHVTTTNVNGYQDESLALFYLFRLETIITRITHHHHWTTTNDINIDSRDGQLSWAVSFFFLCFLSFFIIY